MDETVDDSSGGYDPRALDRTVIAVPLLQRIRAAADRGDHTPIPVVLDLNLEFAPDRAAATELALRLIQAACESTGEPTVTQGVADPMVGGPYLLGRLQPEVIVALARDNAAQGKPIFRIWPDFEVHATARPLDLDGQGRRRPRRVRRARQEHLLGRARHRRRRQAPALQGVRQPQQLGPAPTATSRPRRATRRATPTGTARTSPASSRAAGGRPEAHPLSRGAVAARRGRRGRGELTPAGVRSRASRRSARSSASRCSTTTATGGRAPSSRRSTHIQQINDHGRRLRIHGVNLSLGYEFDPEWFACGQSPLCVEVDRLVRSGVVVVVAAGNTGYAYATDALTMQAGAAGRALTINDPGNAARAITVGSTHRDCPHVYGVSYFSSKGPTGDGRAKPDLVAPGETDPVCAAAGAMADRRRAPWSVAAVRYVEDSGTSMAAPHVSGVIAAFLSIRREFIGQPGAGQGDLHLDRDRPGARAGLPGPWPRRRHARHPVRLRRFDHGRMDRRTTPTTSSSSPRTVRPSTTSRRDAVRRAGRPGHRRRGHLPRLEQRHGRGAGALPQPVRQHGRGARLAEPRSGTGRSASWASSGRRSGSRMPS